VGNDGFAAGCFRARCVFATSVFATCVFANRVFAKSGTPRASVATGFAAVSELGLVVWRFAGDWRAGHEQLSADDGH